LEEKSIVNYKLLEEGSIIYCRQLTYCIYCRQTVGRRVYSATLPCTYIILLTIMQTIEKRKHSDLTDNIVHYYIDCWRQVAMLFV